MQQLWLIPALPFAGFLINGILGRRFSKVAVNAIAIGSVLLSFAWALKVVLSLGETPISEHYFDWIVAGGFRVGCDFPLGALPGPPFPPGTLVDRHQHSERLDVPLHFVRHPVNNPVGDGKRV